MRCCSKRAVAICGTPYVILAVMLNNLLNEGQADSFRNTSRQQYATFSGKAREINPRDNLFYFCYPATGGN